MAGASAIATSNLRRLDRFDKLGTHLLQAKPKPHFVPEDKNFKEDWVKSLTFDPNPRVMEGPELKYIGMPVGGVCAGQVNIGGDGRLWLWSILNQITLGVVDKHVEYKGQELNATSGANYVEPPLPFSPMEHGFELRIQGQGKSISKKLDSSGWSKIRFRGEYPMAFVEYEEPGFPIKVTLEAYSPFIPLEVDRSTLPCVILKFHIENLTDQPIQASLVGWLQGLAGHFSLNPPLSAVASAKFETHPGFSIATFGVSPQKSGQERSSLMFESFSGKTYLHWKVKGEAFGPGPMAVSEVPGYQGQTGAIGKRFATSFNPRDGRTIPQADAMTGKLISPEFKISRKFIAFRIAGGNQPQKTCLNLIINDKIVRSETGRDSEVFQDRGFDVEEFAGETAHIEIVDNSTGGWGHIAVEQIQFTDQWPNQDVLNRLSDCGQLALIALGNDLNATYTVGPALNAQKPVVSGETQNAESSLGLIGTVQIPFSIAAHHAQEANFAIGWSFPNLTLPVLGRVGHRPSARFTDLNALAQHLSQTSGCYDLTKKWHETWYDSTLPRWFLDRTFGNTSTLSTTTSTLFESGRFYGWEGIGCCVGTCGHVYQYAQAMARVFPSLERSVREMVDFGSAYHADSGLIDFRGEYGEGYAVDSQAGYVLRALREHQMSADNSFLHKLWPKIKKALQFMIEQDGIDSGILTNRQHNTLDVDMYGPSSWLSSLYLAALGAGREMATEMNDTPFANQCQKILDAGFKNMSQQLWNGEYFISKPAKDHPDSLMYGDGCEVDQVMGQWWCWQLGLKDRLFDQSQTLSALKSIYKYNFLPDVGPFREENSPGRWYAVPGEGGLVICTFPRGDRKEILGNSPTWASMYFDECMTGFEYEVAGHMIAEGMVEEGLAIIRTVHDRYHPLRRNPWNEVECSDHYARCMAVYGAFVTICGFEHHGPKGHIGFDPRLNPDHFKSAFTACTGWGTYQQNQNDRQMVADLSLKHGNLRLNTFRVRAPQNWRGKDLFVTHQGKKVPIHVQGTDLVMITFEGPIHIKQEETLRITFA